MKTSPTRIVLRQTTRFLTLLTFMGVTAAAYASPVQISVTNHQGEGGFYFTPVFAAFHDGGFDTFDPGTAASAELETLAEEGDAAPLIASLGDNADGTARASTVVTAPQGFPGAPVFDPGDTATQIVDVSDTGTNRYLTLASMIIPTNDAFFGNGNPFAYEVFAANGAFNGPIEIRIYGSDIYDSGTEVNDGLGAPFSTTGGTSSDEGGVVALHVGLDGLIGTQTPAGTTITSGIGSNELVATITITDPNAVPEPTSFTIWGSILLLGLFARRQSRAKLYA